MFGKEFLIPTVEIEIVLRPRETVPFVDEADVRRHIARVNQKQGADVLHLVRIV